MKKIMQRFLGIAAAAALIVTYAVPVMATSSGSSDGDTPIKETLDPSNSYTITLKETETEKNGSYGAYQIFTGTIPEPSSGTTVEPGKDNTTLKLTDIKWGNAFGTVDDTTWRNNIIDFVIALATSNNSTLNSKYSYAFSDFDDFVAFVDPEDLATATNVNEVHLNDRFYTTITPAKENRNVDLNQLAIEVAEELEKHTDRVWLQKFTDILGGYATEGSGYSVVGYTTQYYPSTEGDTVTDSDGTYTKYTITVPAGYYMIREFTTIASGATDEALSARLLFVANNITQTLKTDVPTLKKNIIRDAVGGASTSAPTRTEWKTEAAGVGDTVTFRLTATLPDNYDNFVGGYLFKFEDTFSEGLTVEAKDVKIYVEGVYNSANTWDNTVRPEIKTDSYDSEPTHETHLTDAAYTVSVDAHTLTIDFPCLKEIRIEDSGNTYHLGYDKTTGETSTIYVEYTATVNKNALVYPATTVASSVTRNGNKNTATLKYSDNPQAHDQIDTTTSESATVYTYGLTIDKVDAAKFIKNDVKFNADVALENAVFALVRKDTTSTTSNSYQIAYFDSYTVSGGSFNAKSVYNIDNWNNTFTVDDGDLANAVVNKLSSGTLESCKITSASDGTINISGLNDGVDYYLVEVTPPNKDTYATIDPFKFTLTAEVSATDNEYTGLLAKEKGIEIDKDETSSHEITTAHPLSINNFVQIVNEAPASTADTNGIAELIVANFKYVDLPSTGGTGTYIFYIIGGVVVAASLVLFFLSRKKTTK